MFKTIKTADDIKEFLEQTNGLHDGYIIGVHYTNKGITSIPHGHLFDFLKTKLTLQILVTSMNDTIVEMEFEGLSEWQIRDNQWDITSTTLMFDEKKRIIWSDDQFINMAELKNGSYAIAQSMKWRFVELRLPLQD